MYHPNNETRSSMASASERDALIDRMSELGTQLCGLGEDKLLFGVELHYDGESSEELDFVIWAPKQVVSQRPCLW